MGVRGLTTFILENSETYLKPYELCNTHLVIDGNNVAAFLYRWLSKSHSAFGGDYCEYYKIVADFFSLLNKCGVIPIVLFDGGHEKKKTETFKSRFIGSLPVLRKFANGFSDSKFLPFFMVQTFFDVMTDLGIFCTQCDFEADIEIAATARALNCPVLSYDSDFFIFDVFYIPLSTVYVKPVQYPNSNKCYVRCSIFVATNFLNQFPGLDKSHLPILAILLGNDYFESSLFQKFFNHIRLPANKNISHRQKKIYGVLHWLKKEDVKSATNLILSHVGNKNSEKVLHAIRSSIRDYTSTSVSGTVLDKLADRLEDINLKKKHFHLKIPKKIIQLYSECKIHNLIIDFVSLGTYFTRLQIENVYYQSSHVPALPLIKSLYILLIPYMENPKPLKVYLTVKNYIGTIKVENDPDNFLNHVCLDDILAQSKEERLKWLCCIVGIDDNDLNIVSNNYWSIFVISCIYWIKKLNNSLSWVHIHALTLMVIANEIVQKSIGYFSSYSQFMKYKKTFPDKLEDVKTETETTSFSEMLESITLYEKFHIQSILLPYRQTTEKGLGRAYNISIIHLFNCFQSCLYHIMQLNALLNYPLPHLKISDFYSGTLLFNFYAIIKTKPNFCHNLFKETPNLAKIYKYLCESLCKFLSNVAPEVRKPKKRKRKKKNITQQKVEVHHYEEDKDSNYEDENNPYALLRQVIA